MEKKSIHRLDSSRLYSLSCILVFGFIIFTVILPYGWLAITYGVYFHNVVFASSFIEYETKEKECIIPPPENRAIISAKLLKLNKTEPLRVIATVWVLKSEDVEDYPNFTKAGQEINILFVFYPKTGGEELDPDNPVNKERLTVLSLTEGEIFGIEVSFNGPSGWFGHKAWKESFKDRK